MNGSAPQWVRQVAGRFAESEIARWGEGEWESFALELLWAACRAGAFHEYAPRAGRPPTAASSLDWYRGRRDFLELAEIGAADGP